MGRLTREKYVNKQHKKMQNVKNFLQSKALNVAEYMTPVLKVSGEL